MKTSFSSFISAKVQAAKFLRKYSRSIIYIAPIVSGINAGGFCISPTRGEGATHSLTATGEHKL
jgi:hypothetical protein